MAGLDDSKAALAAFSFLRHRLADPASPGPGAWAFVGEADFRAATAALPRETSERYGLGGMRSALVAALAYSGGPTDQLCWALEWTASRHTGGGTPLARIARFARANWYAEILARLDSLAAAVRADLMEEGLDPGPPGAWRRLANSRLPERGLAIEAGLGAQGRNCLLIVREPGGPAEAGASLPAPAGRAIGPGAVLGLLLLPFAIPEEELSRYGAGQPPPFASACGNCRACMEACPTGALGFSGDGPVFERQLCLQHWSAIEGDLPPAIEARWGGRLYGCDACLEACPHFREDRSARCDRGLLGPGLPADWFIEATDKEIRSRLAGTALGLGWMKPAAFRRNARLAIAAGGAAGGDGQGGTV